MYRSTITRAPLIAAICVSMSITSSCAGQLKAIPVDLSGEGGNWAFTRRVKKAGFEDGVLHLATPNRYVGAYLTKPTLSDFKLSATLRVTDEGDVKGAGVVFRSTDSQHGYFVHFDASPKCVLGYSVPGAPWNVLKTIPGVGYGPGPWHTVEITAEGPHVTVSLDGQVIGEFGDERFTAGAVGFYASHSNLFIKDIRLAGVVQEIEEPWNAIEEQSQVQEPDPNLEVQFGEPFTICSTLNHDGKLNQPHLWRLPCGDLLCIFHYDGDIDIARRVSMRSTDGGKTWVDDPQRTWRDESVGCLRYGEVLVYDDYGWLLPEGPPLVGVMYRSTDGGETFEGPIRVTYDVPNADSRPPHHPSGKIPDYYGPEIARDGVRVALAMWRTIYERADGRLLATAHAKYKGDPKLRVIILESADRGLSWKVLSTVAYDPEIKGEGFCEPVMAELPDGELLCVMRTGGGKPLMQSRSSDGGRTWSKPVSTGVLGVDPDLTVMKNGVVVLTYGRPGIWIAFSPDGTGRRWVNRIPIDYEGGTWSYTGVREVEPGKLLMVWDEQNVVRDGRPAANYIRGMFITVRKR